MLTLMAEEEKDEAWKETIYQVPRGVMAWAVRASTNTLATPYNLARWGRPSAIWRGALQHAHLDTSSVLARWH